VRCTGPSEVRELFRKILCPVDFDDDSIVALEFAAQMAARHKALLHAVHVVLVPASSLGYPAEAYDRLGRTELKRLEHLIKERVPKAVACEVSVKIGNPAEEIIKTAAEVDADLIVMATHGRAGVPRMVLGSVAECVIRASDCPVLVVKRRASSERVIDVTG
jgi:nucleotide-binding universal stress UspA family protein